ncbi:MAG: hypothetical protein KF760_20305 [Candidatus Eremiobacteraeota bacterium]|nr:hypothetical protein [Candidatus Eremiobacteraeota bacterium]
MTHLRRLWSRYRFNNWFRPRPQASVPDPLMKVPMLLPALMSEPASPMAVTKVAVTAVSLESLVCKTGRLEEEGAILRLELQWPDMEPVELNVEVEWVDLSSFGHSLGLSVLHQRDSRKKLQQLLSHLQKKLGATTAADC